MTARHSWMLHAGTLEASQAEALPALTLCVEALTSLPLQLQRAIGIDLRVPSSVMATAMPPGASYKAHLDSHGGVDNPRILTCLLYLGYDPPSGGALRMMARRSSVWTGSAPARFNSRFTRGTRCCCRTPRTAEWRSCSSRTRRT